MARYEMGRDMRLRSFAAATMREAMAQVRRELGPDAIIVATQKGKGEEGARVTAAIESHLEAGSLSIEADPSEQLTNGDCVATIRRALSHHNAGEDLTTSLLNTVHDTAADRRGLDAHAVLALGLDQVLHFDPLSLDRGGRAWLLMGPPGVGKTSLTAKLAARARMSTLSMRVITTDTIRSGGIAQLRSYADALEVGLQIADGCDELTAVLAASKGADLVLIDTVGVSPRQLSELAPLASLYCAGDMDPLLVIDANIDRSIAIDWAHAFAALGCRLAVFTKLDLTQRLGGMLDILHATQLTLGGASITPRIAGGFDPMTPANLSRLLLQPTVGPDSR